MLIATPATADEKRRRQHLDEADFKATLGLDPAVPGGDADGSVVEQAGIPQFDMLGIEGPEIPRLGRIDTGSRDRPVLDQDKLRRNRMIVALGLGVSLAAAATGQGLLAGAAGGAVRGAAGDTESRLAQHREDLQGFEQFVSEGQEFNIEQQNAEQEMAFKQDSAVFEEALGVAGSANIAQIKAEIDRETTELEATIKAADPLHQRRVETEVERAKELQTQQELNRARARAAGKSTVAAAKKPISTLTGKAMRNEREITIQMQDLATDLASKTNESIALTGAYSAGDIARREKMAFEIVKIKNKIRRLAVERDEVTNQAGTGGNGTAAPQAEEEETPGTSSVDALFEAVGSGDIEAIRQAAQAAIQSGEFSDDEDLQALLEAFPELGRTE